MSERSDPTEIIGMADVLDKLRYVASDPNGHVFVTGEPGTGKELVARAVHDYSPRSAGPYVVFNAAAVPKDLFDAAFFGHVRGAFTGAHFNSPGYFEQAGGGTLFVDEIGELAGDVQAKLLRALQQGTYRKVGGSQEEKADVRVVAATNREVDIIDSPIRRDILDRLTGWTLHLLPLRERKEEIPLLVAHFIKKFRPGTPIDSEVMDMLSQYNWPGNVRELQNVICRLCHVLKVDGNGNGVGLRIDKNIFLKHAGFQGEKVNFSPPRIENSPDTLENQIRTIDMDNDKFLLLLEEVRRSGGLSAWMDQLQRTTVQRALRLCIDNKKEEGDGTEGTKGPKTRAALLLGIDRRTIHRFLQRWRFDPRAKEDSTGQ